MMLDAASGRIWLAIGRYMTSSPRKFDGFTTELEQIVQSWGYSELTHIQIVALQQGVADGRSLIVCAPTSSGKTLVAEIAILSGLRRGKRCLYLVSHKALADQKYLDFVELFGDSADNPIASVGLSTGDRDEGEILSQVLIATYEKALALLLANQIDLGSSVVVADELQILGEDSRGPNIETLCAIFRRQTVDQFVALTATIGNAQELADWLGCKLALSHVRDTDLHQEIWHEGTGYRVQFGQEIGSSCHEGTPLPVDLIEVVRRLVALGRGPVLVFTESRNEASSLAARYSQSAVRTADGIELALQLEFFSEPTESSQQLQDFAQKRITFHTADLTAQERQVVERGFVEAGFDVCFATSTLAAGVNFPFKSVVFNKLTYEWGDRQGALIARSDYRNMSGRAGRKGLHPEGYAVLLPKNRRELAHANNLILPENDNVSSQLVRLSMRRTVLSLVSFKVVSQNDQLREFFEHTFFWHQVRERNPQKLGGIVNTAAEATKWLIEKGFVEEETSMLFATPLGKAVAQAGLLPTTAVELLDVLSRHGIALSADFELQVPGLIHMLCGCAEFASERPSRMLPYPTTRPPVNSNGFLASQPLLQHLDRTNGRQNQCAHAIILFARGEPERNIRNQTNVSSGQLHRLAIDLAWILDGFRKIASVPELNYPQTLTNSISMLARRVQWGAPAEVLDILRVAQKEGVPGFGRQRALALMQQGIQTFDQLLASAGDRLKAILGNERRITALISAVARSLGFGGDRFRKTHIALAKKLGVSDIVERCEEDLGRDYEVAIMDLLALEIGWKIASVDDGRRQNVPDLILTIGKKSALIECKTVTKKPPLIKKDDAFAVVQKSLDFDESIRRVTLGKPAFDEHSKKKVQASKDVSLIEHDVFIEGMLRLVAGRVSPSEVFDWMTSPGLIELDRLSGSPSYDILRDVP